MESGRIPTDSHYKVKELTEKLRRIADIAHEGGLVGHSESSALVAIRKEVLPFWRGAAKPQAN